MPTKIGHFEIQSELAKSSSTIVYKANDPESNQTVALKAIQLSVFGEASADLQSALLAEAENSKVLSSPNITPIYGAGEMDGQFCAAMEYVQGNSIATMVARKEGFSIWDLLDIGRQVCAGLEHAHDHKVYHFSIEPSKIMCGWDGTVKILSFGVSGIGKFTQHIPDGVPSILHYMSPEQIRGEEIDGRSNLFSLGAMFYEMVTDRKAFDREDAESLRQCILESTPVPPAQINPKLHPLLSDLIMKALEKDPAQRYQRGRELLDALEKCKETKPQAAAKKPAEAAKAPVPSGITKPAAAKPVGATSAPAAKGAEPKAPAAKPTERKFPVPSDPTVAVAKAAAPKAAAAAAGWGGGESTASSTPEIDLSSSFTPSTPKNQPASYMSSAVADEPAVETFAPDAPKIAVDPMMAEGGSRGGSSVSFSEMTELPPLKEVYVAPPPPPPLPSASPAHAVAPSSTVFDGVETKEKEEKPKIQPREVAQKAIKEIKGVPPKLMLYSIAGAVALILVIAVGFFLHVHSLNGDDDTGAARPTATTEAPAAAEPAPSSEPAKGVSQPAADPDDAEPVRTASSAKAKAKKKAAPVAPAIIPGQMVVDSTPQGAQAQVDGRSDPSYVTPFLLSNLQPGQHTVTVSKPGYSSDTRTVDVNSGNKASVVLHMAQLMATLSVNSNPVGASIFVDGKDMGKLTPTQVSVDKGSHVVLVRKMGYIDETTTAQFVLGQTISFAPALRPLGNVDNIRTVNKMSKLFGGKGGQPGQGTVSIHTQPKGAQVAVNQHMLEKNSPVDVMLDPGNYVIDISLSGYAPVHKVVTVDKGGKAVVDETLQPQ
jgi:serine/threonine protein kinase